MMAKTHIALGLTLALFSIEIGLFSFFNVQTRGFLSLVFIGSLLPDLDHPESTLGRRFPTISRIIRTLFGHRGLLHSILGGVLFAGVFYILLSLFSVGTWKTAVFAVIFGFKAHLIADSLTPHGVKWLHPLKKLHIKGPIQSGGLFEWGLFVVLVFLIGTFVRSLGFSVFSYI